MKNIKVFMKNITGAFPALVATPLIFASMLMPVAARAETNSIEALFHRSAESLLPPANIDQCSISGFGSGEFHNQKTATVNCPDGNFKITFIPGYEGSPVTIEKGDTTWSVKSGTVQELTPVRDWKEASIAITEGGRNKIGVGIMTDAKDTRLGLSFVKDDFDEKGDGFWAYNIGQKVPDDQEAFFDGVRSRVENIGQKVSSAFKNSR